MDSEKSYEFRIKIVDVDPSEKMDQLENALEAFRLDSISKPKRLPIEESNIDFPSFKNCQLFLMDVVLRYPCNNDQLRAVVAERTCIPAANIVVVPKNHPEEIWRWNINGESELREYVQGEAVLDKPYEDDPEAKAAGDSYASATSILKELSAVKQEVAEGAEKTESAKTTNELPQGNDSPVGSKQNTIPAVKGKK